MSIVKKLIELGFKEFHNPMKPDHRSFQLKVYSENGYTKLYFVNVALFDYNNCNFRDQVPASMKEDLQPEWSVQFNTHGYQETFDVNWLGNEPKEALKFYHKVFVSMNCESYD